MQSYQQLLRDILEQGESHSDRTGVGTTSLFDYNWSHDMRTGFPLLTTKRVSFRWVAEELRWFLSGSTNEADLAEKGVDIWKEWATPEQCAKFGRKAGNLGPVYGALWRRFPVGNFEPYDRDDSWLYDEQGNRTNLERRQVDQITILINEIVENPGSRRLIVSGWHPHYQRRVALPPCHTLWQCKVHQATNELSLKLYARSIDAFLGLPFNIASYALLLSLLAHVCDLKPRKLAISFGDLHIYNNHRDQVEEQLSRDPRTLPKLVISDRLKGTTFDGISGWTYDDLSLRDYLPHPKIEAPVAV